MSVFLIDVIQNIKISIVFQFTNLNPHISLQIIAVRIFHPFSSYQDKKGVAKTVKGVTIKK